jgi:two-component system phosphate regulon sensor histidine kinase PhoR
MMNNISPKQIARRSAIQIGVISAITSLLVLVAVQSLHYWFYAIALGVVIEEISYFVIYRAVEDFINQRIKVLYKTISKMKGAGDPQINMEEDAIGQVNQEVMDWASDQIEEITFLRETDSFRKDFIGNLAHELKTPLFNIQGFILSLIEGGADDPEIRDKFLLKAEKNIDRMTGLLEDLDSIYKIESGALIIDSHPTNIVELCQDIVDSLHKKAEKANITLKVTETENYTVLCDVNKIEQVVSNLIVNSINYGNDGGKTLVKFFDMGDNVLVEVSDNGIGIKKRDLMRIYERFYRVDKSRSRDAGGSGLGLAIVKHIIEAHGQNLHVRSNYGKGTTFSFTLQKVSADANNLT